ncbi:hypothetical protein Ancab_021840 [Ancistrocladus abbreviatus]
MGEQSQNPSSHSGIYYEENNDIFYYVATKHGIDSDEDPFLVLKQESIRPIAHITLSANQQPTSPASGAREPTAQKLSTKINNKSSVRVQHAYVDSVDNDFGIKLAQKDSGIVQEPDEKTIDRHVDKRSSLRAQAGFFDSNDSSAEEDVPRQTVTRTGYSGSGFSQRTRDTEPRSFASSCHHLFYHLMHQIWPIIFHRRNLLQQVPLLLNLYHCPKREP